MDVFTDRMMIKVKNEIMNRMKEEKDIIMTEQDEREFDNATHCFMCGECFEQGDKKVRDHCHFTGKYRGCAHDDCNLGSLSDITRSQCSFTISRTMVLILS